MRGQSFDAMRSEVLAVINEGYPMSSVLSQIHDDVVIASSASARGLTLTDLDKALICEKLAKVNIWNYNFENFIIFLPITLLNEGGAQSAGRFERNSAIM